MGQKQANAWGLYDMHGNVSEWCRDWYADKLPGGTVADPVGPNFGRYHVGRGAGWRAIAECCSSSDRICYEPDYRNNFLGFRLALSSVP